MEFNLEIRAYTEFWLKKRNLRVTDTGFFEGHEQGGNFGALAAAMKFEHDSVKRLYNVKWRTYSTSDFVEAMKLYIYAELEARRRARYEAIKFSGIETLEALSRFVTALTCLPPGVEAHTLAVHVLAHHISNVKRKMAGLDVQWHVMPLISGPQGTGKTVAVKQLYSPLGLTFEEMDLGMALNMFTADFVERYNVVLFDEMAGLDRADINALKRMITSDGGVVRKAHTADVVQYKNRCSFIGTTNEPANLLLRDSTGARRFFEVRVERPTDRSVIGYKNEVAGLDYFALWRGIDETVPNKYFEAVKESIALAQENLRAPDVVEEFFKEHKLLVEPGQETTYVELSKLFPFFMEWAKSNNYVNPFNKSVFGRKLTPLGVKKLAGVAEGRYYTALEVNVGAKLSLSDMAITEKILAKLKTPMKVLSGGTNE